MLPRSCCGWLLVLFLVPNPLFGQSRTERNSESVESPPGSSGEAGKVPDLDKVKEQVVKLTNAFRAENKLGALKVNAELGKAAQPFAEYMARTDKFSHTADGKEPWERVAAAGYAYCIVLENIAYEENPEGFTTEDLARRFVQGWKDSPPHRKNMLDPDIEDIGIGVARSSQTGRYYAVQNFGRPKSKAITFKLANLTDAAVKVTMEGQTSSISPRHTITYERCRSAELKVEPADTAKSKVQPKVLHPKSGSRYVIRKDQAGSLSVERE
jgi:uncharacterized protein YkwD